MIQASQLLHGNLQRATALIRSGGWAAISSGFAEERHAPHRRLVRLADAFRYGALSGGGDHDERRMVAWGYHDQYERLPPLLADQQPYGAGGEPHAWRDHQHKASTPWNRPSGPLPDCA